MSNPVKILIAFVAVGCLAFLLVFLYLFLSTGAAHYALQNAAHPAQHAAKFEDPADLDRLLKNDPKAINSQDAEGMTPVASAIVQERTNVVQLLLDKGADVNIANKNGDTPLDLAASRRGNVGTVLSQMLLAKGANLSPEGGADCPLGWAVNSDNTELVKMLLERGADPKKADDFGVGYLHDAADRGDVEIAGLLIAHGVDVNVKMHNGCTPLHQAAEAGRDETVKFLLSKGAQVDAKEEDGITPLMLAANKGQKGCVEILLNSGANINAQDSKGETPLMFASVIPDYKEVADLLRQHGAKR